MNNPVVLNYEQHKDLKIDSSPGASDRVNRTLAFVNEFDELHKEFPILFHKDPDTGAFEAHAILGFDIDDNLFVGDAGWLCRTVPAMLARGPFLIGAHAPEADAQQENDPVVLIDTDDSRVGVDVGEVLFLPNGNSSPYLESVLRSLRIIHHGKKINDSFFKMLQGMDLVEPISVKVTLSNIEQVNLQGYHTINDERLARLDGSELKELNSQGFLGSIFFALYSLGNINRLIEIRNRKSALV